MRDEVFYEMKEAVKKAVGVECEVLFDKVEKNNGVVLQSVIIREPEKIVAPQIYVDEMLMKFEAGEVCFQDVIDWIVDTYKVHRNEKEFSNLTNSFSKEKILENVIYQVVNKKKNERRLLSVPNKDVLDLVAMYRVIVSKNEFGFSSFIVSNEICRKYQIDRKELDTAARKNTKEDGFETKSMVSVLAEISGMSEEVFAGDESSMYVITNKRRIGGASVMIYPKEFQKAAFILDDDLYVLPSSIHEVIVVPAAGVSSDELSSMVHEINATEVSSEEFLSNSVYRYNRADNSLRIVGKD